MTDHTFGVVEELDRKEPVIVVFCDTTVGLGIDFVGRHDIENGEAIYRFSVIQRQAVRDTAASIMTANVEFRVSEMLHHSDLIYRHFPFGIEHVRCIETTLGLATITVSAKVASNHGKILCQTVRDLVPHDMALRIPVQEQ